MVIENTTPATVMTAAAIAIRIWRATSGPPELTQDGSASRPASASRSRRYVMTNRQVISTTIRVGRAHKLVRRVSRLDLESGTSKPPRPRAGPMLGRATCNGLALRTRECISSTRTIGAPCALSPLAAAKSRSTMRCSGTMALGRDVAER
jgi:hypothetical protein